MNYNSQSGNGVYKTIVEASGAAYCTCPGYRYRRTCRHLDAEWRRVSAMPSPAPVIDYSKYALAEEVDPFARFERDPNPRFDRDGGYLGEPVTAELIKSFEAEAPVSRFGVSAAVLFGPDGPDYGETWGCA